MKPDFPNGMHGISYPWVYPSVGLPKYGYTQVWVYLCVFWPILVLVSLCSRLQAALVLLHCLVHLGLLHEGLVLISLKAAPLKGKMGK